MAQKFSFLNSVWFHRHKCAFLFASLLLLLVAVPFLAGTDAGRITAAALHLAVLITAVGAVGQSKLSLVLATLFALPSFALNLAGLILDTNDHLVASRTFGVAFYLVTLGYLLRYVFKAEGMDGDKLFGAAAAYLLLGSLWSYLYGITQHFYPTSFALSGLPATLSGLDFIYFSFTTLTSTGYGDFTPVSPHARALANLEQICGILFVAILIARLTSIYPRGN